MADLDITLSDIDISISNIASTAREDIPVAKVLKYQADPKVDASHNKKSEISSEKYQATETKPDISPSEVELDIDLHSKEEGEGVDFESTTKKGLGEREGGMIKKSTLQPGGSKTDCRSGSMTNLLVSPAGSESDLLHSKKNSDKELDVQVCG